jgi:shikimate dehydrogenase
VVIGMGAAGAVTRVCPWLCDSLWTYAGDRAPGQIPAADLIGTYRVPQHTAATSLYALTGAPLAHSASPAMFNAAFAAAGLDAVYVPMESRDATAFMEAADAFGVIGASVTAPLKAGWDALGVSVGQAGLAIGAINTLKRGAGAWSGRNFDVDGFLAPLVGHPAMAGGRRAVVLGAGGAARAIAWALKREGWRVEIAARPFEAARVLAAELGVTTSAWPPAQGWDLLVNATPVGTWPDADQSPLPAPSVRGGLVYDLVYNPPDTALLRAARAAGADAIGGLDMLVAQAEAQFGYWTGRDVPAGVMADAAKRFLQRWAWRPAH